MGSHLVLVALYHRLQLVLSKNIRIGDTKYHIKCSNNGIPIYCNLRHRIMAKKFRKSNMKRGLFGEVQKNMKHEEVLFQARLEMPKVAL